MAVPYGKRYPIEFDELFPEGAYVVGAVTAMTEYHAKPGASADPRSAAA